MTVFQNSAEGNFEPKNEDLIGKWIKLRNVDLQNLCPSPTDQGRGSDRSVQHNGTDSKSSVF
jgi:hypothetical protein